MPTMDNAARDVVERFMTAWFAADLAAVMACVTDDIVFHSAFPQPAVAYRGRAAVEPVFAAGLGDDPGTTWSPLDVAGDMVFARWRAVEDDGTRVHGVDVYTVRDGLIAVKDVYTKLV